VGLRKAVVWLGLVEQEDAVLSYEEHSALDDYLPDEQPGGQDAPGGYLIVTVRPQTFRDALIIGDRFRRDIPVIVNLQDMEIADGKRIVDFMSGLIFGRLGDIQRLGSRVFLIVPGHYRILREQEALPDEGFFNQA
jgi:cell division inhibitor SepF